MITSCSLTRFVCGSLITKVNSPMDILLLVIIQR